MRAAVLVIDMQVGVMPGCFDADGSLARTQALVERARDVGAPVIWIHDEDDFPRGSADWQLAAPLTPRPDEDRVFKSYRDGFVETTLADVLTRHDVSRVVVAGAQSDYCVRTTAQRAAVEGYDVTLVSDCHTTTDATFQGVTITGEQIVAHTNQYFAGLRYPGRAFSISTHDAVDFENVR